MKKSIPFTIAFLFVLLTQSAFAQNALDSGKVHTVCNDFATYLPQPEISKSVIDGNAKNVFGVVNVQVLIDGQGNVKKAKAVTGHPLLHPESEKAALKAKFRVRPDLPKAAKINCVIAYNFTLYVQSQSQDRENKYPQPPCTGGVCNSLAIYFPKPVYGQEAKYKNISGSVSVKVSIDEEGNVTSAKACSGHPLLRPEAEKAAVKAKFRVTKLSGEPVKVNCLLVYNFISEKEAFQSKELQRGIINGSASYLPRPDYPQEARGLCAEGSVQVLVELMASGGKPLFAKAVSGDKLLKQSAEKAAMKAVFRPLPELKEDFKIEGILVYNFVSENKCINVGIVNKKAVELPKPTVNNIVHPGHLKLSEAVTVEVIVIIDENGKVTRAKATTGHPLFRPALENAARKAKFPPTFINGKMPKIRGIIVYKINPDATIETDF